MRAHAYNDTGAACKSTLAMASPDCNYDPRYTEWYVSGRISGEGFTSSYTLPVGELGMASVAPLYRTNSSTTLLGIWGTAFRLSSLSARLLALRGGFASTLFYSDTVPPLLALALNLPFGEHKALHL